MESLHAALETATSTLLGAATATALLVAIALLALKCVLARRVSPKAAVFPGPAPGSAKAAFRALREDAFLLHLRRHAPATTLELDGAVSSADPAVFSSALLSRANSVGRSIVYRLVAWVMPSSDGILFAADEEWARRHSLFLALFQPKHVSQFTAAAFEGAVRSARAHAAGRNPAHDARLVDYDDAASLLRAIRAPRQNPLGVPDASPGGGVPAPAPPAGVDLLSLLRWSAMRTFFAWAAGVDADAAESPSDTQLVWRLGRTLDSYARVCFEIMPQAERRRGCCSALGGWLLAYWRLWAVTRSLRRQVAALVARYPAAGAADALFRDQTNAGKAARAGASSASSAESSGPPAVAAPPSPSPLPETFLRRMLEARWPLRDVTSELNHLHGAHKAVAFVATAALAELSSPGRAPLRLALVEEMRRVCGLPPPGADVSQLTAHAAACAASGETGGAGWRLPCREDLEGPTPRLELLRRVWKETLRRHVVSMGVMRRLGEDMEVPTRAGPDGQGTVSLPKGSELVLLLHALHHDPQLWGPDAHHWLPERWDADGEYWGHRRARMGGHEGSARWPPAHFPALARNAYFPFLEGTRRCAGMHLAELQFAVLLYALVGVCDVAAVGPDLPAQDPQPAAAQPCSIPGVECDAEGIGGGLALVPGVRLVGRTGAIALVAEPATVDNTGAGFGWRRGAWVYRWHLVKRADMFSTIDGHVSFRVGAR